MTDPLVSVLTVPLASAVGPDGRVIAFEPVGETGVRLRENAALNLVSNGVVHTCAVGDADREVGFLLSEDPSANSTVELVNTRLARGSRIVPSSRLDTAWVRAVSPKMRLLKVDMDGDDTGVLRDAKRLLSASRPAALVEATSAERRTELERILRPLGYRIRQLRGFKPWNFLFLADGA